jgi:hypothetical protein
MIVVSQLVVKVNNLDAPPLQDTVPLITRRAGMVSAIARVVTIRGSCLPTGNRDES